jgi:hypothetical protein
MKIMIEYNIKKENRICFCGDSKKMHQNVCDECHEKRETLTNKEFLEYYLKKIDNSKK